LITRLIHASSGQWQSSLLVMPLSKVDPQGYGSALTNCQTLFPRFQSYAWKSIFLVLSIIRSDELELCWSFVLDYENATNHFKNYQPR
jgi:hypothetical protein